MLKTKNIISIAALLLLGACEPKVDFSKWTEEEKTERLENCIENVKMKMTIEKAKEMCSCMLQKTMEKYPDPADVRTMDIETLEAITEDCSDY